eukprot:484921_1
MALLKQSLNLYHLHVIIIYCQNISKLFLKDSLKGLKHFVNLWTKNIVHQHITSSHKKSKPFNVIDTCFNVIDTCFTYYMKVYFRVIRICRRISKFANLVYWDSVSGFASDN